MENNFKDEMQNFYGMVKVNQNGQIIIPADLRKELKIKPGVQLLVFRSEDGDDIVIIKMEKLEKILKEAGFSGLKGLFSK